MPSPRTKPSPVLFLGIGAFAIGLLISWESLMLLGARAFDSIVFFKTPRLTMPSLAHLAGGTFSIIGVAAICVWYVRR